MKIFIGASARNNIPEEYIKDGEKIAKYIVQNNDDIIICADERGIVGKIYSEAKKNNNKIILTLPKIYEKYAININEKIDRITETINERTQISINESDICLFLPGGIGTMYEILTAIETKRAGEHNKPILILNSNGYYDKLIDMINKAEKEKFLNKEDKEVYCIADNVEHAIKYINNIRKKG